VALKRLAKPQLSVIVSRILLTQNYVQILAAYSLYRFQIGETDVELGLWDTAGQERFFGMLEMYLRQMKVMVLFLSVVNESSVEYARRCWNNFARIEREVVFFVVANKIDLPDRKITPKQGETLAKEFKAVYMETSAKSGVGCRELFVRIGELLLEKFGPQKPVEVIVPAKEETTSATEEEETATAKEGEETETDSS
jgi:Ras-related protein Rab-6A